jgi:hypothetical protein
VGYAAVRTLSQWWAWSQDPFTALLLTFPLAPEVPLPFFLEPLRFLLEQDGGYFAFYAWGRFWLPVVLAVAGATLWYCVVRGMHRYAPHSITMHETHVAYAAALLVGWPYLVVYIPLVLGLIVIHALLRAARGVTSTPALPSLLLAFLLVMLFGAPLLESLTLTVLML